MNPYESPHARDCKKGDQPAAPSRFFSRPLIAANLCAIFTIVATQPIAAKAMADTNRELPWMTSFAIGTAFPVVYVSVLMIAMAFMRLQEDLIDRDLREVILVVICGVLFGYYLIAVVMPFAGGPAPLT